MKNKKGFTLVELLAVIAILGLLVAIAVPSITSIMSKNTDKVDDAQAKEFTSLAKIWGNDYSDAMEKNKCYYISLNDMVNLDLLAEIPTDSNGDLYPESSGVQITKNNSGKLTYSYANGNTSSCKSYTEASQNEVVYDNTLTIPSTGSDDGSPEDDGMNDVYQEIGTDPEDNKPNAPVFDNGSNSKLVPAVYDETCDYGNGCWRVADVNKNWYNYSKGIWANIIELRESYCDRSNSDTCIDSLPKHYIQYYKSNVGTRISTDNISAMYVWIPRFSISSVTISPSDNSNYPKINGLKFVSKSNSLNHKAFSYEYVPYNSNNKLDESKLVNGKLPTKNISGFWVAKFEGTGEPFLKEEEAKEKYFTIVDRIKDQNDLITNLQWGAIVYLAYSNMGIAKDAVCNYEIKKTDLSVSGSNNDKFNSRTGIINGNSYDGRKMYIKTNGTNGETNIVMYSQPIENRNESYCGSTSGTVYGVYDMVGGLPEIIMAFMSGPNGKFLGYFPNSSGHKSDYYVFYDSVDCSGNSTSDYSSYATTITPGNPMIRYASYSNYIYKYKKPSDYDPNKRVTITTESINGDATNASFNNYIGDANNKKLMYCEVYNPGDKNQNKTYAYLKRGIDKIFDYYADTGNDLSAASSALRYVSVYE